MKIQFNEYLFVFEKEFGAVATIEHTIDHRKKNSSQIHISQNESIASQIWNYWMKRNNKKKVCKCIFGQDPSARYIRIE